MANSRDLLFREIQDANNETSSESQDQILLDKLPLIICGPILRKIHYQDVSVWLAFKEDVSDIKIKVFEAGKNSITLLSGNTQTIELGKNLFVNLITAIPAEGTGLETQLKPILFIVIQFLLLIKI